MLYSRSTLLMDFVEEINESIQIKTMGKIILINMRSKSLLCEISKQNSPEIWRTIVSCDFVEEVFPRCIRFKTILAIPANFLHLKYFLIISPSLFLVAINISSPTLKCIKTLLLHGELGDCNPEMVMLCYSQPG